MLKLTIYHSNNTGIQARLKSGTKIRMKVKNPMFGDAGLFSYLIKVYREENDRIFNYAASLDNFEAANLTFKLEVGTDVFAEGVVKVTESTDDMIEFYLKSGSSSVAKFMKETPMNQTEIWGTHDFLNSEKTIDGCYPDYPIIAPPLGNSEGLLINYGNSATYSAVYIRHLINNLISGLGFTKQTDVLNNNPDFNRIALFAHVYKKAEYPNTKISRCLPAVSLQDWRTDLRTRFNIFIYFSPFLYDAEVLNIADCLNLTPVDWTNKFKSYAKLAPPKEKQLYFTQDNEDKDHLLSYQSMIDGNDFFTVATKADMTQENVLYLVQDIDRFMEGTITTPESLTTQNPGYHFRPDTISYGGKTYRSIVEKYLFDYSETIVNSFTEIGTLNFIDQFIFPLWDGVCDYSWGYSIQAKSSHQAKLIVKLVGIAEDGTETEAGYSEVDINSTEYITITKKLRASATINLSSESGNTYRLALRFYCKSSIPGAQITMQYGGIENGTGDHYESEGYINPPITEYNEVGVLGDVTYGDLQTDEKPITYKAKSKIPVNNLFRWGGYLVELPQTNLEAKDRDEQTDFEYIVYRGKKLDVQQGVYYTRYCNFDVLDHQKEDYTNKLETPVSPEMSLAWRGEKGLLNKQYKNRLTWERYFKREAKINMELTANDIMSHKIYAPFTIKANHFVIDELDFELDEMGDVSNCQITPYTL